MNNYNCYENAFKYMHPYHYFVEKNIIAKKLNLDSLESLNILDIGAGAGHFLAIANHYGHNSIGLDIEYPKCGDLPHIYDALTNFYQVDKIYSKIDNENGSLPVLNIDKQDLVTGLMTYFNKHNDGTPWSARTWSFFLKNISDSWLKEDGAIFLNLTRGKINDESWAFLKFMSEWYDEERLDVFIKNKKILEIL